MSPGQYKLDIPTLHPKFYRNYTLFWKDHTIIAFYNKWIIFSPTLLYIQERKEDTRKNRRLPEILSLRIINKSLYI